MKYKFIKPFYIIVFLTLLMVLYYCFVLFQYLQIDSFLDHAEPGISVRAYWLSVGVPVYHSFNTQSFLLIAYGPLVFLVDWFYFTIGGPSILTSKLGGVSATLLSLLFFALYVRRELGGKFVAIGLLLFMAVLFHVPPFPFWSRPDSFMILLVAAALWGTTFRHNDERGWIAIIIVGACLGLIVNLKFHAGLYLAPIIFRYFSKQWFENYLKIVIVGFGFFLLPFLLPEISLVDYVTGILSVLSERIPEPEMLTGVIRRAALFASPGLLVLGLLAAKISFVPKVDIAYYLLLLAGITIATYPSTLPGAGWYHMVPFIPISIDLILRFSRVLEGKPKSQLGIISIYALTFLVIAITPQKRLLQNIENLTQSAASEMVRQIISRYPGRTIEMGYGENLDHYPRTFVRPILAFAGNPVTLDGWSDMESIISGLRIPPAKLAHMENCATDLWLIPAGEMPFTMPSYYSGKRAFWSELEIAFHKCYRKENSFGYFDVWGRR